MHLEIWVYSIHYTDRGQIQHQLKRYGQNSAFSNSRGGVFTIENDHPYPHLRTCEKTEMFKPQVKKWVKKNIAIKPY